MDEMDWMRILEQTPLPVAMVLGGAWMLRQAAVWIAERILGPLLERHLGFLDGLEDFLRRMTQSQETLLLELRRVVEMMEATRVTEHLSEGEE